MPVSRARSRRPLDLIDVRCTIDRLGTRKRGDQGMYRKAVCAFAAALALGATGGSASAAGPSNGLAAGHVIAPAIERVSYWGEPYPYGYRWRLGCLRHVAEETPWGRRWHLVWVCR